MVETIRCHEHVDQLELLLKEGPLGVKRENLSLIKRTWQEKATLILRLTLPIWNDHQKDEVRSIYSLAEIKVQIVSAGRKVVPLSEEKNNIIERWNAHKNGWQEKLLDWIGINTFLPKIS